MGRPALDDCVNIQDLRALAERRLPRMIYDFMIGGADDEYSVERNTDAFSDYELIPDTLVDVSTIDMSTTLLGKPIAMPLMLSPTGGTKMFHHLGELPCAGAASKAGIFYAMSTVANSTIEDVAAHCPGPKMFQLYVFRDRGVTHALLERCQAAGFDAMCLTVDTPVAGNRERDVKHRLQLPYRPSLRGLLQIATRPAWAFNMLTKVNLDMVNFEDPTRGDVRDPKETMHFVASQFDRSVTWRDVEKFADICPLPLVIKGVMSVEDARRAANAGARAIMISNHGGRQMDGVPAPIDLVAEIRAAVGDKLEIIVDGGVRRGSHIVKALARGANACSVGRPYLYGLAAGGHAGVSRALAILRRELEISMALMGVARLESIRPDHVRPRTSTLRG